jgi:hypothetical protein
LVHLTNNIAGCGAPIEFGIVFVENSRARYVLVLSSADVLSVMFQALFGWEGAGATTATGKGVGLGFGDEKR